MDHAMLQLFDHVPDASMILTSSGKFHKVNTAFENNLQYRNAELTDTSYSELATSTDNQGFQSLIEKLKANRQLRDVVHTLHRKDGTSLAINWSFTLLDGFIFGLGRNLASADNEYQSALKKEQLFETLVENTFDLLAVTDADGKWTYVSDSLATLLQTNREELIGLPCFAYIHPEDLSQIGEQMQALLGGLRKIQSPPYRFKNGKGEWLWMEAIVTNQLDNPDVNGIIITGRDISDRVLAEKNAKEVQLLEALREGEEKERSRISRDLHDQISGMVAAAKMHLSTLGKLAPSVDSNQQYHQGLQLLDETARQIRNTSHNLMPEILLENGLDKALHRYINSISHSQLQICYTVIGNTLRYSTSFELSVYRILQELLNNILKHSKASAVLVQLSFQTHILSVTIEDNGIGFNPNEENNGTGLRSIRKRVAVLNGSIEIQSAPGKGTNIYIEFTP